MKISKNFNRFYHSQIKELFEKVPSKLKVDGVGVFYVTGLRFQNFKQVLKYLNIEYPRDGRGIPVSTRDLTNQELVQHIEFIFKVASESSAEMSVIQQEWELLLRRAN